VRTQVGIGRGGTAGLLLERRSCEDLETMVRAGEIDYVTTSRAAATNIVENHVGAALG